MASPTHDFKRNSGVGGCQEEETEGRRNEIWAEEEEEEGKRRERERNSSATGRRRKEAVKVSPAATESCA